MKHKKGRPKAAFPSNQNQFKTAMRSAANLKKPCSWSLLRPCLQKGYNRSKKKAANKCERLLKSGRQDSNLRSPVPKTGALTGLGHAPPHRLRTAKIVRFFPSTILTALFC